MISPTLPSCSISNVNHNQCMPEISKRLMNQIKVRQGEIIMVPYPCAYSNNLQFFFLLSSDWPNAGNTDEFVWSKLSFSWLRCFQSNNRDFELFSHVSKKLQSVIISCTSWRRSSTNKNIHIIYNEPDFWRCRISMESLVLWFTIQI